MFTIFFLLVTFYELHDNIKKMLEILDDPKNFTKSEKFEQTFSWFIGQFQIDIAQIQSFKGGVLHHLWCLFCLLLTPDSTKNWTTSRCPF